MSGPNSLDAVPARLGAVTSFELRDGVIDELSAVKALVQEFGGWDYNTLFHAAFHNTLLAGNVNYSASTVSAMKIKQRKKGDYVWQTCFVIPILDDTSFSFERFYRYAAASTDYEFALVPVLGEDVEGNYSVNEIKSEFDGYFFVEKDAAFQAVLETGLSLERNQQTALVIPFKRKYPIVVKNGDVNYTTGSLQAAFIEFDPSTGIWKTDSGWSYREKLIDFLTNGKPKIYKDFEGRIKMVSITDVIPESPNGHYQLVNSTIHFVEIGDCTDVTDMYAGGFTDFDKD